MQKTLMLIQRCLSLKSITGSLATLAWMVSERLLGIKLPPWAEHSTRKVKNINRCPCQSFAQTHCRSWMPHAASPAPQHLGMGKEKAKGRCCKGRSCREEQLFLPVSPLPAIHLENTLNHRQLPGELRITQERKGWWGWGSRWMKKQSCMQAVSTEKSFSCW